MKLNKPPGETHFESRIDVLFPVNSGVTDLEAKEHTGDDVVEAHG